MDAQQNNYGNMDASRTNGMDPRDAGMQMETDRFNPTRQFTAHRAGASCTVIWFWSTNYILEPPLTADEVCNAPQAST